MASRGRGSSVPLSSKAATEILCNPALTILGLESVEDASMNETTESVPSGLIRLSSLEELMNYTDSEPQSPDLEPHPLTLDQLAISETRKEMFCNTCQTGFVSREDQVEHYRLDWHRYNIKRRLKGLPLVNSEDFETLAGDLSSISGSESDSAHSDNEQGPSHSELSATPFIYFTLSDKNGQKLYAVYRSVVTRVKRGLGSHDLIRSLANDQVWIILMRSGGHFAGAVFKGLTVLAHKTFHRYTVRAKRGTAQSVRDGQSGGHAPKSAGATLRRYNESALAQEMQDLLSSWENHVRQSTAIFIRTPKYSKEVLVGGPKAPFSKDDPRLRDVPFPTRRPTLSEVKRVHVQLASLYKLPMSVLTTPTAVKKSPQAKKKVPAATSGVRVESLGVAEGAAVKNAKKKKRKAVPTESQPDVPDCVQTLLALCNDPNDNVELLTQHLHLMGLSPITIGVESRDTSIDNSKDESSQNSDNPQTVTSKQPSCTPLGMLNSFWGRGTPLHIAATTGNVSIISSLLLHGADPAIKDQSGKTPYLLSKDKPTRDSFRRFMASHPMAYNYDHTHIPSPLTQEMEKERRDKANEKKKAQKKARREREKAMKPLKEAQKISEVHEKQIAGLSDRERRALAAERRMVSQLPASGAVLRAGGCSCCHVSLAGLVPFERLSFKYCSMDCLKDHRKHLEKS